MCGINGILRAGCPVLEPEIERMRDQFPTRGPDDRGSWVHPEGTVGLGHRRLSILDPSPSGHQPMHSRDDDLIIVFNGEVYNYLEIRRELQKKGHQFQSRTDTEVLLKAYGEWGTQCLQQLNGMFAFAIWDERRQELFLARDRLGIKPLYYYQDGEGFYFASEVKAITAVLTRPPALDETLIDSYMSFGYIPGCQTLQRGMRRLLPGHYMRVACGKCQVEPYWDLKFASHTPDRGESYYLEKGSALINDAIDIRLRSDVPLGVFLSGGLDSSAVVGLLAPRLPEALKTFSVAYDCGRQFNETKYARVVARKFKTEHHEIFVSPREFVEFVPEYVRLMDEPVTEAAAISLFFVSQLAKEQVTVVLSGEGADEIFGGYDLYRYMAVLERYHRLLGKSGTRLLDKAAFALLPLGSKVAKYLSLGAQPFEQRYKGISTYEESNKGPLYTKDFARRCRQRGRGEQEKFLDELFARSAGQDCLSRMLYFDTKTWLVDDLLIKADRMSMAASLELRVPFLDYRLVEFAAKMPSRHKIHKGQGKHLLKKMMADILPKEIIYRKKMGFPTPLKRMFENELYGYARELLLSGAALILEYFEQERIRVLLEEHVAKRRDHHRLLWQLLVLEIWLQQNASPGLRQR